MACQNRYLALYYYYLNLENYVPYNSKESKLSNPEVDIYLTLSCNALWECLVLSTLPLPMIQ